MTIADRVSELLQKQPEQPKNMQEFQARYRELVEKGLVEKRTYDLPQVNVMGVARQGQAVAW